jgi:outer membrane protein assembly factor BamD (BamD/ComL family)
VGVDHDQERRVITCALIHAYLEKYPNNEFSPLAQKRISELTRETHSMIE